MDMTIEDLAGGARKAVLRGRMDFDGAAGIEAGLKAAAASAEGLVIDLAGVDFLASMGVRALMLCARTLSGRGRRVVLAAPQPNIAKVLHASGADEVMAVYDSPEAAAAALAA